MRKNCHIFLAICGWGGANDVQQTPNASRHASDRHGRGRWPRRGRGHRALRPRTWPLVDPVRVSALDSTPPEWLKGGGATASSLAPATLPKSRSLVATRRPLVELFGHPRVMQASSHSRSGRGGQLGGRAFSELRAAPLRLLHLRGGVVDQVASRCLHQGTGRAGLAVSRVQRPEIKASHAGSRDQLWPALFRWLRSLPPQIGIYTPGDLHAVRVLDACRKARIAVPDQVAILGRGNDPIICETVRPTMSSLDPNPRRVGYEAAGLLAKKMAGKAAPEVILIRPKRRGGPTFNRLHGRRGYRRGMGPYDWSDRGRAGESTFLAVAHQVGLSCRALEIKFRQYLGRTPKAEIRRVQIEHAKTTVAPNREDDPGDRPRVRPPFHQDTLPPRFSARLVSRPAPTEGTAGECQGDVLRMALELPEPVVDSGFAVSSVFAEALMRSGDQGREMRR